MSADISYGLFFTDRAAKARSNAITHAFKQTPVAQRAVMTAQVHLHSRTTLAWCTSKHVVAHNAFLPAARDYDLDRLTV